MIDYIKLIAIYLLQIFLRAFFVFPIKQNRIFFSTHEGEAYNCNPKYIFEYMYEYWPSAYEYIWCLNNPGLLPPKYKVRCIKIFSLSYFYYLFTSKVIISNLGREVTFPKRKKQLLINTWHGGGAYKIVVNDVVKSSHSRSLFRKYIWWHLRSNRTDYIISSCQKQVESHKIEFNIDRDKCLNIGTPRNDCFFNYNAEKIRNIRLQICEYYHIEPNQLLILYAPTYRRTLGKMEHTVKFDVPKVCAAIKKRFNREAVLLYRSHTGAYGIVPSPAVDVSNYLDMQELLLAVDVLITDYSSSIWDYTFTYKPGFLYTPDLEQYTMETNFHTPIDLWPYPYAKTIDELCNEILFYNEESAHKKIDAHHALLGSYEHGNATKKVCDVIQNFINQ